MDRLPTTNRGSFLACVILGGTFEAGNWSMDADAATTTRIIEGNAQIARGLRR